MGKTAIKILIKRARAVTIIVYLLVFIISAIAVGLFINGI